MKSYIKNGYEYFYDNIQKQWVLYPIDSFGIRIEWDSNDNPIECMYFNNKSEVNNYINNN